MRRRSRNMDKELDLLQRLKNENQKLKKEVTRLRKEMDRLNNRYSDLEEAVSDQYEEVVKPDPKKQWECHVCKEDYLRLIILNRPDGVYYFRKCGSLTCKNKTRLKKYHDKVEGLRDVGKD